MKIIIKENIYVRLCTQKSNQIADYRVFDSEIWLVKFKEKEEYEFPTLSTLDENITLHVWDLINLNDDYIEGSLKKVGTKKIDDTKYIFFEALSKEKDKINDFHYIDGFWHGFVPIKDAQPKFSKTTRNIYNAYLELKENN